MKFPHPLPFAARAMLAGLALAAGTAASAQEISVDQLLDRHLAVIGESALAKVNTLELDLEITESNTKIHGHYATDRSGRMRVDISVDGNVVWTEGLDGDIAWALEGGKTTAFLEGPEAKAALQHGPLLPVKILSLREARARGVKFDLQERSLLDGINYHVLRMTFPDGFKTYLYINPDSHLIERQRDERAMHPDADLKKKRLESRFSDFRRVEGVLRSFHEQTYDLDTGKLQQDIVLKEVRTNVAIDPKRFAMPK